MIDLRLGDCLKVLTFIPDNSVDSVVTDPPYGLSFMGKNWDYDVPSVEIWNEVLRVLKPGGHLLSFFGTRTYHRGVVRIEDAGFEIRDQIQWIYGSGFPKSHNLKVEWQGLGTALKPANEPIVVARKLLEKGLTVTKNVTKWGTGAINVDGSRIGYSSDEDKKKGQSARPSKSKGMEFYAGNHNQFDRSDRSALQGRWPANVLLDEAAAEMLDEQSIGASRFFYVAKASKSERNAGLEGMPVKEKQGARPNSKDITGELPDHDNRPSDGNNHPTVKPIKLMQYLINLVTPSDGTVLDPFMGSGSTGVACKNLNRKFIGIEKDQSYFEIAQKRIDAQTNS